MINDKYAFESWGIDTRGNTAYFAFFAGLADMVGGYCRRSVDHMAFYLDEAYRLGRWLR